MKFKKIVKLLLLISVLFFGSNALVYASDVNLVIRDGDTMIFSGTVPLAPSGNLDINDVDGNPHSVNTQSVLAVLNTADQGDNNFSISNLTYYNSFGSFYVKCLTYSATEKCDYWQYVVNDTPSFASVDQNILSGGETIYVYFGNQHRVRLNTNQISVNQNVSVTAENYNYTNNSWSPLTGVTAGLTQINPNDAFNPIEISTQAVDGNGEASFTVDTVGEYDIGIKEDYYFPTEHLSVASVTSQNNGSGSGNSIVPTKKDFDINKAFLFLLSNQLDDGSFGADIYTDWASMALATSGEFSLEKEKIKNFLLKEKIDQFGLTDYERRSMVLMSLGLSPYDVSGENYIKKISSNFDGIQFGDMNLVNDDIFALIVLQNAGFSKDDEIIKKTISFIISKQNPNGSWEESVDLTGASMQALGSFVELPNINSVLGQAKDFLKKNQKSNGGWSNVSSTSWAIQGIVALGENPKDWIVDQKTPMDYLSLRQEIDGGMVNPDLNSKVWETSYAVFSASFKTWNQIMQKFEKVADIEVEVKKEERKDEIKITEEKPVVKTAKSLKIQNTTKDLIKQNTASVIDATAPLEKTERKQGWVGRFFGWLFGV